MSSSYVANSEVSQIPQIPECGCNKPMKLFISNSRNNPKRRYWKCANVEARRCCSLFIWDDELDGRPPYDRKITMDARNVILDSHDDATTHSGSICCSCSELLKDLHCFVKELRDRRGEQMEMKLQNEGKIADKLNLQHFDEKKLQQMYLCHKLYLKKRLLQKKKIRKFYSYEEFCKQLVEVCNLRAKYGLDPPKEPAKELIQSAPVNTGVDARKSYHASVYRASLQNDASRRSNKHSKVSGIAKGKGEAGEGGSRQRCVQEVTSSTINDRLSVEVEVCNLRAKYGLDPPKEPAKELIQSAPVNTGVDARKSYHASVYRASLQNDASRRSNKHSKVSGIAKGKGEAGEGGSRQRCVQEVTSSTINDRLSVEVEVCNLRAKYRLDPLKEPAKELIQSAPVNTGVDSRKSYHASVYRASLQSSASRR
ncbi:uncharacterized protein LOC131630609 [Vicia villosa]|uniref:uncharacterized protein LOC131630609 n=1 Tax=Vicia villosa TaxID=3911 RepID=UPI00273C3D00|nr:uncharacterized protein LOC131630609 [Vicia villosa]